ncbi:MAG: TatD DNase family protein [Candidatus Peregrinibacteria bacterium Greene0416_62]|nr:MAG: TatD DNase family protein [Candidatus Peregrinibacteria bacterium Greene0416_62]TSD00494.1 MAG: TatD DNase family protein [Candidatus Peregrinibacteria bacterium Greene1014_49]
MIDSHCHLADAKFDADLDAVVARATQAGVDRMICIGDSLEESQIGIEIAEKYEQIFCTIGIHPHHADAWEMTNDQEPMTKMLFHKKAVAVGEIGLDYHYMHSPKEVQQKAFREQLLIAKELQKPAVVHCRSAPHQSLRSGAGQAVADIRSIINEVQPPRVVIHCCTEKWEDVEALVRAGHFLSFTGIATFPASEEIRRTIRMCPLEQMMIETDSPYLAPVPYRGKRNEPAYVVEVAKCVANEKGIALAEVDRITTENTVRFFALS